MRKTLAMLIALIIACAAPALAAEGFSGDTTAINEAAKSVLMLEVYDADNRLIATASGFVAFNSSTLITNHHVIEDAAMIRGYADDGSMFILNKVYDSDEIQDIAILGFMFPTNLTPLELCTDFSDVLRASAVVAIGSPQGFANSVSLGNISAFGVDEGTDYVQFTAPISSGSSGGALFNDQGEVIGITSWVVVDEDGGTAQNLNFAVNIHHVIDMYNALDTSHYQFIDGYVDDIPQVTSPAVSDYVPPSEYRNLVRGDSGADVKDIQIRLKELNYPVGNADGIFGVNTENAIILFNMAHDLRESPKAATAETQRLLFSEDALRLDTSAPALEIPLGGYATFDKLTGDKLSINIEVENVSSDRTVTGYQLAILVKDQRGNELNGGALYYWTTRGDVAPGEKPYSDEVEINDFSRVYTLHCAVSMVYYDDGSVYIEDNLEYFDWDFSDEH